MNDAEARQRRLHDLVREPREHLDVEYKSWISPADSTHGSNIAKALLALANHGGGFLVFGFSQGDDGRLVADQEGRPENFKDYDQDRINALVADYAVPIFHCEVHIASRPEDGLRFPVVIVPGGHRVPIRARRDGPPGGHVKRDWYYTRRPGPRSEPPQTGDEWDQLIRRCILASKDALLGDINALLASPNSPKVEREPDDAAKANAWISANMRRWTTLVEERGEEGQTRFQHGYWRVAYKLSDPKRSPTLRELRDLLQRIQGSESGWPPWLTLSREPLEPKPVDGCIETWLFDSQRADGAHSDFWRVSPEAYAFLLRGYQEDGNEFAMPVQPGETFEFTLPIWRVAECLLHARRFAADIGNDETDVHFDFEWTGLRGRHLIVDPRNNIALSGRYKCAQQSFRISFATRASIIDASLVDLVHSATSQLLEVFDFFRLTKELVASQIKHMRPRQ